MNKKIIFTTGGTGGHIFPAINLMKHFFEKGYKVVLVTDRRGKIFLENKSEFKSYVFTTGTPTNKNLYRKILSFIIIFFSLIKSIFILTKEKPNLILGFGGYVSFPISFMSKFFNLPLIIYENNMILGRANKYLSSFSKKILISRKEIINLPDRYKNKTYDVGAILDKKIFNILNLKKDIDKKKLSILVLGGSQGAEIFGTIIPAVIKNIKKQGHEVDIAQQCVLNQKKSVENFYKENDIENYIFEFDKNILKLMASADLAITRCGASATAELTHILTPFIAVPLPHSIDNHQYLNAKYYEKRGCCLFLDQKDFDANNLFNLITKIIENNNKLDEIKKNMRNYRNENVYQDIENQIKKYI